MSGPTFQEAALERSRQLGISVPPSLISQIEGYYQLLARWNQRINLTSLPLEGFPASTLDRLIFEPLAALVPLTGIQGDWFDIGSGGGSPAIPIRLAKSTLTLTMVEPRARKAAFLREAVRQLQLGGTTVLQERIEDSPLARQVDLVTMRALRVDDWVGAALAEIVRPGGTLVIFGGPPVTLSDFALVREQTLPGGSPLRLFSRL